MTPALILFDCDGVLVDSEILLAETWSRLIDNAVGVLIPPMTLIAELAGGAGNRAMADIVAAHAGRAVDPEVLSAMQPMAAAAMARDLKPVPGAASLLSRLDTARAVCSNTRTDEVAARLRTAGLMEYFDESGLFGRDRAARPKPAPDLYRAVLETLTVDAGMAVAVEDSSTGIRSASAAGLRVIGFIGGGHRVPADADRLRNVGAVEVLTRLADLPDCLAQLR